MTKLRTNLLRVITFLVFLTASLFAAEYGYRRILFGGSQHFKKLRKPQLYAEYDTDDYWKLYHIFDGALKAPQDPHPLLGWIGDFDPKTFKHHNSASIQDRRPILLYGDSFASCVSGVKCFEFLLNNDAEFAKNNYLLNYGVGGYGVDQITLLLKKTYRLYQHPFVIFSIMCADLDRSVLTYRIGQKPYYELAGTSVVLKGIPVQADPNEFFNENPPQIKSYLWRRILFSPRNPLPQAVNRWLKGDQQSIEKKILVNRKILQDTIDELKQARVDFTFLVFHYLKNNDPDFNVENEDNWRDKFLREFIEKNQLRYIWSKEIVRRDPQYRNEDLLKYIRTEDGHPTTYFNQLIAAQIKKAVMENREKR